MRNNLDVLKEVCASSEATQNALSYRNMSPRLDFGEGGLSIQDRLLSLHAQDSESPKIDLEDSIALGWATLETGAHLPAGVSRGEHIAASLGRFTRITKECESPIPKRRLAGYGAQLALAAVYAYQTSPETALEDNPGYYATILERVLNDTTIHAYKMEERRGLVSVLTIATLASHCNLLTLPTSTRHERPLSIETPSSAHDLQVWFEPPTELPTRPDRKAQVKTKLFAEDFHYANNITLVSVNDDLIQLHSEQLARALVRLYNGASVNSQNRRCIKMNGEKLDEILHGEIDHNTVFAPQSGIMRPPSSRSNKIIPYQSRLR